MSKVWVGFRLVVMSVLGLSVSLACRFKSLGFGAFIKVYGYRREEVLT